MHCAMFCVLLSPFDRAVRLCRALCYSEAIFLGVITGSSTIMALMDTFVVKEAEWQAGT